MTEPKAVPILPLNDTERLMLSFPPTDKGQAELFAAYYADEFRCALPNPSAMKGRWHRWDEHTWTPISEGDIQGAVAALGREQAAAAVKSGRHEAYEKWGKKQGNQNRMIPVAKLAQFEEPIRILQDDFDRDPMLLGTESGIVDLRTGRLRAGKPEDLITKRTAVPFDPKAKCPLFLKFLDRILKGDKKLIKHMQLALGYACTGKISEHRWWFMYGRGSNGKSTLSELIAYVLGDYSKTTTFATFLKQQGNPIPNDLARLQGARFIVAGEPEDGKYFDAAKVKSFTGGDKITARFLNQEFFEFNPVGKLFFCGNHKPHVSDSSEGYWRRATVIPFEVKIPEDEKDKSFIDKLKREAPGVLAWLVAGAKEWSKKDDLMIPSSVLQAIENYKQESDPLGSFFEDCCDVHDQYRCRYGDLRIAYLQWCNDNGVRMPLLDHVFQKELTERGFGNKRVKGKTYRAGVRPKPSAKKKETNY